MQLEVAKNVLHNIRAKNIRASSCSLADQEDKRNWGEEIEAIDLVLEKLEQIQKENEELNNRDTSRLSEIGRLRTKNNHLENEIKYYYIPKDKIRAKLEKIEKEKIQYYDAGQPLIYMLLKNQLKSLIEEKQ